jgi:cell division septal protein FtsQ
MAAGFYRYIAHSSYFALEFIHIEGNERLADSALLNVLETEAGIGTGSSVLALKERRVRRALEELPEITNARVKTQWPSTLTISVEEETASGIYVSDTGSFVYNPEGELFAPAAADDFLREELPLVTGLESVRMARGSQLPARTLSLVHQYSQTFRKAAPALRKRVSEWHLDDEENLTIVLNDGVRLACGNRPPEKTGPVIETLLDEGKLSSPIEAANLFSDLYVSLIPEEGEDTAMLSAELP